MSSILDALRRIEREEDGHRGAPLDLGPEEPRFGPRRRRPWATIAIAIGLAGTVGGALWLYWPDGADVDPVPQEHLDDVARLDTPPGEEGGGETNAEWEASVKAARLKQRKKALAERRKQQQHAKQNPTASAPEQTGGPPAADAARAPVREPAGTAASLPARSDPAPTAPAPPTPALAPAPPQPAPAPPAEVALAQPEPAGEATLPWKRPFVAAQEPEDVEPTVTALAGDADADDAAATRVEGDPFAPPAARPSGIEPPAATAEPPPVVANIAPRAGVLEPPTIAPGTADMGGMEPPSRLAEDQPTEDLSAPTGRKALTAPPTHLSRAERLEELKEQRAIPQEDRPAAPTAPSETPPAALPEGEKVLQRLPSGAPKVRVNFLFYSREPARRRIMVTVDNGSLVTLFEGQSVDTLGVERILPNEVHFRFDGKLFAVRPRY